jgi:hypothetical protein
MTIFYILLKVSALLAIIIIPLMDPKKKKAVIVKGYSNISVNEHGYLENNAINNVSHHPVH